MRILLPALAALALLTGCSRARVTTEIRSGGAFTRSVALTGQEKKEGQMDMGGAIEDSFVVPTGAGWKSTSDKKDANLTTTFVRTFAAGATSKGDLTIKGDGANPALISEVVVTRLTPKRFEYRETLRWDGPPPDGMKIKPEDLTALKAALPKALATDENANGIAQKVAELAMPTFFGPGDPLLAIGLLHPDLAARRMNQKIGGLMMKALEQQFGDKMTASQRREITLKLIDTWMAQSKPAAPDPAKGPPSSGKSSSILTPLMFVVKSPGKVISSNGEVDELTGEVYWALFPPAAALKPVVLTAVLEFDQP
jgi:hypothetical protein